MNGFHKSVLFAMLMVGVAMPAYSQSNKKFEAFGSIGLISYAADSNYMNYGGGFGFRPYGTRQTWMRGWELEFALSITDRPDFYTPTQTQYTANVLYHFLSGRVQPYALIGVGGYYEPGDSSPPSGAGYASTHKFLANAGGGLRIVINDRWSIRPEFRGFDLRDDEINIVRYGVFVGYHF